MGACNIIRIFGIKGFKFEIDWLFFAILPVMALIGLLPYFLLVFAAILVHEICHMLTALSRGAKISAFRVLPVGVNIIIHEIQYDRTGTILILLSGPLSNLIIWAVLIFTNSYSLINTGSMRFFASINLYLALFNLLPVIPLDGGRLLREFAFGRWGIFSANRYINRLSLSLAILFVILGIYQLICSIYNYSLIIIGLYMIFTIKSEKMEAALMNIKNVVYRRSRLMKKGIYPTRDLVVLKNIQLNEMIKFMDYDRFHVIHVLDDDLNFLKTYTEQQIMDAMIKYGSDLTFDELLKQN